MTGRFSERMSGVGRSFIREILKATADSDVISFAGGLPSAKLFPVDEMADACAEVFEADGAAALQYQVSEGYRPLREYVAMRYRRVWGLDASADDILITSGSQQALDLIGKVFLDRGDRVVLERPAYLGAIQAFGMYEPEFVHAPLDDDGIDCESLRAALAGDAARIVYVVPSFQNPSGVSYSCERRRAAAAIVDASSAVLVEDDPYGELAYDAAPPRPVRSSVSRDAVMLGTFSKTVAPGLRVGWVWAKPDVISALVTAKQAADLHSDSLSQRVLYRYLMNVDVDEHIERIRGAYRSRRDAMLAAVAEHFPSEARCVKPSGGMFLWVKLPGGMSTLELFDRAMEEKVAFVPGTPFHVDGGGDDSMRLCFSNSDEAAIEEGIRRLGRAIKEMGVRGVSV
jgi:2-aminoadipate transaminase